METNLSQVLLIVSPMSQTPPQSQVNQMSAHPPSESASVICKAFFNPDIFHSDACICKCSVASVSSELSMVENHNGSTSLVRGQSVGLGIGGSTSKQVCGLGKPLSSLNLFFPSK